MVVKGWREGKFKQAKLAKTKSRREGLARERRIAERKGCSSRNDLLPRLTVCNCPIADLRPPYRWTRKHDPKQIERLIASISEYGFSLPVLVREGSVLDGCPEPSCSASWIGVQSSGSIRLAVLSA